MARIPTHRPRDRERERERESERNLGSGKSKEASGRVGITGMGSRQQIIEALSIDVPSAISDSPAVTVPICACEVTMGTVGILIWAQVCSSSWKHRRVVSSRRTGRGRMFACERRDFYKVRNVSRPGEDRAERGDVWFSAAQHIKGRGKVPLDPSSFFDPHRARKGRKVERTEMS